MGAIGETGVSPPPASKQGDGAGGQQAQAPVPHKRRKVAPTSVAVTAAAAATTGDADAPSLDATAVPFESEAAASAPPSLKAPPVLPSTAEPSTLAIQPGAPAETQDKLETEVAASSAAVPDGPEFTVVSGAQGVGGPGPCAPGTSAALHEAPDAALASDNISIAFPVQTAPSSDVTAVADTAPFPIPEDAVAAVDLPLLVPKAQVLTLPAPTGRRRPPIAPPPAAAAARLLSSSPPLPSPEPPRRAAAIAALAAISASATITRRSETPPAVAVLQALPGAAQQLSCGVGASPGAPPREMASPEPTETEPPLPTAILTPTGEGGAVGKGAPLPTGAARRQSLRRTSSSPAAGQGPGVGMTPGSHPSVFTAAPPRPKSSPPTPIAYESS